MRAFTFLLIFVHSLSASAEDEPVLTPRNLEAPFCYVQGATRCWPILERDLAAGASLVLALGDGPRGSSRGRVVSHCGLDLSLTENNQLQVVSCAALDPVTLELEVILSNPHGATESQVLEVRPAPPPRPLSYLADFGDDIIRIFMDTTTGKSRAVTKTGFDQYFRRLQAQGISRLIVWPSPFPYIADPENYGNENWGRYEEQAKAIVQSEELATTLGDLNRYSDWGWIRQLLALRLMRDFGAMVSESACQHGVALTASFRPFEVALTKYYEIPAFDTDGDFLWGFLPLASPTTNYRRNEVCFAHYRRILSEMGHKDLGELQTIELPQCKNAEVFVKRFKENGDNLKIFASHFPPLQPSSLVLHQKGDGGFSLRKYEEIAELTQSRLHEITGCDVLLDDEGIVSIVDLAVPECFRYLLLTDPSAGGGALKLAAKDPVVLRAKAGNRLGRNNVYWVLNDTPEQAKQTRVAGIPEHGNYHSEFRATECSRDYLKDTTGTVSLWNKTLVIDRGEEYSVEMLDFNQKTARENAIAELRTILAYPAFDEIFVNTRSHTALISGIDTAYAPRAAAIDETLREYASTMETVEKITMNSPGEWDWGSLCRTEECPFSWRLTRNREVANGLRLLLEDIQSAFPGVRVRAVIPPSKEAISATQQGLDQISHPDGGTYASKNYYRNLANSINYIGKICEGMSMVDYSGLEVEPVVFGIRYLVDQKPFERYVQNCLSDFVKDRSFSYTGPKSFFYEAQETLRNDTDGSKRRRREEITCYLLSFEEIDEVIYYEAADWTYSLPLSDPDHCGHGFLERCGE